MNTLQNLASVQDPNPNPLLRFGQSEPLTKFHDGHLVESETYIGGHVECLEVRIPTHSLGAAVFGIRDTQECLELSRLLRGLSP